MNCPRQDREATMESQKRHVVHVQKRHGWDCCSYCGSLLPEEFFRAIELGCEIGPTDKTYKAYVTVPNADVGRPQITSTANFNPQSEGYVQVTPEVAAQFPSERLRLGDWVQVGAEQPTVPLKFYFQHLDTQALRDRFIELHNAKKIKIGFPGHFYVRPFFCSAQPPAATP